MIDAVKEYDVIFLSYKEENKETNWEHLKSLIPKAKRVDGVKGFDAAHRAVGEMSTTSRTIVIDGDNWVHDNIVDGIFISPESYEGFQVISYAAVNFINGLSYGNGGLKIWPTELLRFSSSHELSDQPGINVDFITNQNIEYVQKNESYSFSVQNASKEQAFASGYREGVKLSINDGWKSAYLKYYLNIWTSIGRDVDNGEWAIYGARLGIHDALMKGVFDPQVINDIDYLYEYAKRFNSLAALKKYVDVVFDTQEFLNKFDIYTVEYNANKSSMLKQLIKNVARNPRRRGSECLMDFFTSNSSFPFINPIKCCDVVFLSYKEENKEVYFDRLKTLVPKAKRVDGVKGFDAAHRAVGEIAETEYVIVVDGDNWVHDEFVYDFIIDKRFMQPHNAINFASINKINGMIYENGGVKLWHRDTLKQLNSHENSDAENTKTDFCFSSAYNYLSNRILLSITDQTSSPEHAFSSGYRECVKQCLNRGVKLNSKTVLKELPNYKLKLEKLFALLNLGADVNNGMYAMYGARLAFWVLWYSDENFNIEKINDVDALQDVCKVFGQLNNLIDYVDSLYETVDVYADFGIPFDSFTSQQSKHIKNTFNKVAGTVFSYD